MVQKAADFIVNTFFEKEKTRISPKIDVKELEETIQKFSEEYFRNSASEQDLLQEFDFQGVNNYLSGCLKETVFAALLCQEYDRRECIKDTLYEKAYSFGNAKTNAARKAVYHYVTCILEIVKRYLLNKTDNGTQFLGTTLQDEVIKKIKETEENIIRKIKETVEYEKSFAQKMNQIVNEKKGYEQNVFHYLNASIGYYGRQKEQQILDDFLDCEEQTQLLALTGDGGMGKSKLMYHYMEQQEYRRDWRIVWLRKQDVEELCGYHSWKYRKNLLMIIDYCGEVAEGIGKWVDKIANISSSCLPPKLRIILLERNGVSESSRGEPLYPYWFQILTGMDAQARAVKKWLYPKQKMGMRTDGFLELSPLEDASLKQMLGDLALSKEKKLSEKEKEEIIAYAKKIEKKESNARPLIVLFVADTALDKKEYYRWNIQKLIYHTLKKSRNHWKQTLCKHDEDLESLEWMLVYATALGGWNTGKVPDEPFGQYARHLQKKGHRNLRAIIQGVNGNAEYEEILRPLEPDILGEAFVLEKLLDIVYFKDQWEEVLGVLWKESDQFVRFLMRAIDTYYEEEHFAELFQEEMECLMPMDENAGEYRMRLLFEYVKSLVDDAMQNLKKVEKNTEKVRGVFEKYSEEKYPEEKGIRLEYAKILECEGMYHRDKCIMNIIKVKELMEKFPEDSGMRFIYDRYCWNLLEWLCNSKVTDENNQ